MMMMIYINTSCISIWRNTELAAERWREPALQSWFFTWLVVQCLFSFWMRMLAWIYGSCIHFTMLRKFLTNCRDALVRAQSKKAISFELHVQFSESQYGTGICNRNLWITLSLLNAAFKEELILFHMSSISN